MMAQEENALMCCGGRGGRGGGGGGGGGGCRSKKAKKTKVPQRGLGVAQLEKIRAEEQLKKAATPFLAGFRPNISPSPNPVHSSPAQLLPSNSLYKPFPSRISVESLSKPSVDTDLAAVVTSAEQGNWPKSWNVVCTIEDEKQRMDHRGFAFRTHFKPYDLSNIISPRARSEQPQSPHTPALVQASSGNSLSYAPSSEMEPPSNQSSRGKNCLPFLQENDKMAGMKRSNPFSLETRPTLSSLYKRHFTGASFECNAGRILMENRREFRHGHENSNLSGVIEDNERRLNGDFLTLAPPSSVPMESKPKNLYHLLQASDFEHLPRGGSTRNRVLEFPEHHSLSFFPVRINQENACLSSSNNETIDLDLKL